MKSYKIEITLADNKIIYKNIKADDELQAIDKVYEHYSNNNIKIYDIKVVE